MYILPIGDLFYENTVIKARSFDLTQFLISVNFRQLVEFQSDGQVCSVRLRSVLIDIQPKTLNDLTSIRPKETAKKSDFCTESLSPHHLSIERIAQHRGRRVSFGAIRCIPQPEPVDENKDTHQENAVDEFVDRFLGETMEQVLIR
ncbi:unnamed protein product [Toxocara canis]|uniref:Uncharacterized protein n=1 Tax=Toxocara canis TaxID=6265 RepID=A0A3P7EPC6_TOXCA|nr:unnamed protein product [Toxocara canis]